MPGSRSRLKKQWKCNSTPAVAMETMYKNDAPKHDLNEDSVQCKDGLTADLMAPWHPYFLKPPTQSDLDEDSHLELVLEWVNKKSALLRTYGATAIMFPDITPKKIFLDATRELAKHTNNLTDEVWNYMKRGKLVHAGVLLLAAQDHIRLGPSCKKNGNSNPNGFATILSQIANHLYTFDLETGPNEKELDQPHGRIKYFSSALLLVNAISQTGKTLHEYIQIHSEVSHADVIERVSSILKNSGFYPPEEGTDIGNLCPYQCQEYKELLDNPDCMKRYEQFPLHQAAKTYSVDMVKLLIRIGVSANVRMAGEVEGRLPLHVAVENTCLHKYVEDNLLPNREHPIYSKADIYKLIHILCLPEMKVFLDTTRELAKHTNDLVDEIWNYIKGGKLVHAGVVLLAAQELISLDSFSKKNGNGKPDGFATIVNRIVDHFYTFDLEMDQHEKELKQPHANIKYLSCALLLINVISQAGKTLQEDIGLHSEVPHVDALERISSILKDGFYPAEEGFNIGNLYAYKWLPYGELPDKHGHRVGTKKGTKTSCLRAFREKAETKKVLSKQWEHGYKLALFFPYWRSVLASKFPVKLFPCHASGEIFPKIIEQLHGSKSMHRISTTTPNDSFPLFKQIHQHVNQPRRSLSTAAMVLKVLKYA